ncbi:hypothetical protein H0E87_007731 [Populus deltoides]|uniref:Uncharacterized protein n=1 Tax=Populus deltoides TaxID=3696 RepID=A0A8T2YXC8_POPDE|nr:hypothetical protein H0E87_007731 [Populus deltoides]
MLPGYVQKRALSFFHDMTNTETTWITFISSCSLHERGSTEAAGRILDEYKSSVTWNAMISVYAKSRSPELCYVAAFDSKPDEVTLVSVISAYGHPGALELSNWEWGDAEKVREMMKKEYRRQL